MSILESLPCPHSPWLASIGIPLEFFQAIFLHPYFQINYPKSTRWYRILVIPICVYLALATVVRRTILPTDEYLHFNFCFVTMPTFHFICLSIIYGFHQGPVFKSEVELFNHHWNAEAQENAGKNELEEQAHPVNKSEVKDSSNCSRNRKSKSKPRSDVVNNLTNERHKELPSADQASKIQTSPRRASPDKPPSIGELTRWISALIMNPRGLICTWSPPEHVVPIERNLKMKKFMINLILRTVMMHFCFQCVCAIGVEVLINSKADMDHFLFERLGLTPLTIIKSVSPFLLTMTLAGGIYSGFSLAGGLFNIVEIAAISILRLILPDNSSFRPDPVNPSNYPPLFNDPWCRTSLTEFWGKGWQAVFRHHLLFCGAQPMYNIFRRYGPTIGKFAAVMGAMGLSAAMHEFCLVSVSKIDPNFSSVRMFLSQGIGIVLEAIFKKFTGHKVSGPLGWVWTLGYMTLNGRPMVNAWIQNSLGRGVVPFKEWRLLHILVPFGPLITDKVYAYMMSWVKLFWIHLV